MLGYVLVIYIFERLIHLDHDYVLVPKSFLWVITIN